MDTNLSFFNPVIIPTSGLLLIPFILLNFVWGLVLFIGGTYVLVNDMVTEARRGTLDLIRLSPQSSQSFLLGKLLGVPSFLYFITASFLPLQLLLALIYGVIGMTLQYYIFVAAICAFLYTSALLYSLLAGQQASSKLAVTFTVALLFYVVFFALMYLISNIDLFNYPNLSYHLNWFFRTLSFSNLSVQSFALFNLLLWTYLIWNILNRRFQNPNKSVIFKRQSYCITACFELVFLVFLCAI